MRIAFDKMHGLGNDFVVIDRRDQAFAVDFSIARAIADRHRGIGCDQLILLDASETADLAMRIFNADGGEAEACGNAARCVAGLIGGETLCETRGGLIRLSSDGAASSVDMGKPRFAWDEIPLDHAMDTSAMPVAWDLLERPFAVNVGNPHVVFFVGDADAVDFARLGPEIEHDPLFPERINVNVAAVADDGTIKLRVWERGAGLTQACGTGACATAVAAISRKLTASPVTVVLPGGSLEIAWREGGTIRMTGPAAHVFHGEFESEAFA